MISVIIVGYNSIEYLSDCLKSIYQSDYKKFRVIFVDNQSTDGSADYVQKSFPQALVVRNKSNNGYAGGNNIGIKEALKLKSDYVFLLNPDTIVSKSCLTSIAKRIDGKTILQPLILLHENGKKTELVNTTGNRLNFLGFSYCNDYRKPSDQIVEKDIPAASGAAMFLPVSLIKRVGAFDESFFMYHEDVDLCWRLRMAGYNIKLIPEARIWHKYHFGRNKQKMYWAEKNRLRFILKNYSLRLLVLIALPFIINEIMILLYSLFAGWFFQKIKADFSFLQSIFQILKQRKEISHLTDDRVLKKYLSAELDFSEMKIPVIGLYNKFLLITWRLISKLI